MQYYENKLYFYIVFKMKNTRSMLIRYSFLGNTEPTDEQLHLLMQEVAADVK